MSDITVDKINNLAGTGAANFTHGIKVGGSAQTLGGGAFTNSDSEPSSPSDGDIWYAPTVGNLDYRAGGEWKRVIGGGTANPVPHIGDRMLTASGNTSSNPYKTNAIRYIDITGSGGSSSFGSLTANRTGVAGTAGGSRGLFAGGIESGYVNKIEYVTTSTTANATDFGDMASTPSNSATASNGITAMFAMGQNQPSTIEKVTIDTAGNATTWGGSLTNTRNNGPGASDGTKGFFIGGYYGSQQNVIDYVTIATEANAADWGDLITARNGTGGQAACGTSTRVLVAGGNDTGGSRTATIEYINPASASNAYSFGNLTAALFYTTSACNEDRAIFANGLNASSHFQQIMNYVQIDTAGNAASWGNSGSTSYGTGSLSGAAS